MGKSGKKRRQLAKRRMELDKLRGVSLMDVSSPSVSSSKSLSPTPPSSSSRSPAALESSATPTTEESRSSGAKKLPNGSPTFQSTTSGRTRKRMEFVLPRALGKTDQYLFGNHSTKALNEELQAIPEEEPDNSNNIDNVRDEPLDDILYPERKRRREEETIETTRDLETKKTKTKDPPPVDGKKSKQSDAVPVRETKEEGKKNGDAGTLVSNNVKETPKKKETKTKSEIIIDSFKTPPPHPTNQQRLLTTKDRTMENGGGRISGYSVEEAIRDKAGLRPRANSTDFELNLPQRGLCDERMVLEAHRWNLEQNYIQGSSPKGFDNLGNTCFLNSTLQCLAYLPPFCQSLVTMFQAKKVSDKNGNKQITTSQGQKITSMLCRLFQTVHGLSNKPPSPRGALAPNGIVKALPTLSACGSRNGYKFRPGRQEDAHEFLVHLLDAMHDGELRSAGINQHVSGWRDRLPVPRLDETTFVHRIFGGYLRSQVRCIKCGHRSNTYDPFLDLSLEVSKKSSNSLASAFSEFTRRETLDSANRWKCSGCKKHVCATKQLTVFRPPLSLCIQLKRFTYGGGFGVMGGFSSYGGGGWKPKGKSWNHGGSKITKPIEFPVEMDLPLSDGRSCPYMLTGIVIHVGGSASSGHYTAYVKKPGRKGKPQWYHLDDSFVDPVSEGAVLRQKDAYVLFYCRKEVKLEFPSPPPRGSMSAEEAKEYGRARARARADSVTSEDGRLHTNIERIEAKTSAVKDTPQATRQGSESTEDDSTTDGSERIQLASESIPTETTKAAAAVVQQGPAPRIKTKVHPLASPGFTSSTNSSNRGEKESSDDDSSTSSSSSSTSKSNDGVPAATRKIVGAEESGDSSSSDEESEQEQALEASRPTRNCPVNDDKGKATNDIPESSVKLPSKQANKSKEASDSNSDGSSTEESSSDDSASPSKGKGSHTVGGLVAGPDQFFKELADRFAQEGRKSQSENSSSESSSSSENDSDDDSAGSDQAHLAAPKHPHSDRDNEKNATPKLEHSVSGGGAGSHAQSNARRDTLNRTRVIIDKGDARGKVEVMLGPRKRRRTWQTKASTTSGKGLDLLGNVGVDQWGEDNDQDEEQGKAEEIQRPQVPESRSAVVKKMEKEERSKKRQRHLDRWDSLLDQGKRKKMKSKSETSGPSFGTENPKKNVFQRIQSGIQKMNRGKAKGFFRRNNNQKSSF